MKTIKTLTIALAVCLFTVAGKAAPAPTNYIDKVVGAYLEIKNALIAGDGNTVKLKAKALLEDLSTPDKSLDAKQQATLKKYQEKLAFDSRHMSETTDIDHQREHFASLSSNFYELVRSIKMNNTTLYEEYCPMKKAYWLSDSNKIENPYFGSKMLDCGKVTETIKPVK